MNEIIEINNNNLVLEIRRETPLFLSEWDDFLDVLCFEREYQKEAILKAITYLTQYSSTEELFKENFKNNTEIQKLFNHKEDTFLNEIQLRKDSLSANIDIATAGGKSYVMYGISQIMISEGYVDRVLLLCPSTTIERGLKKKFITLITDEELKNSIPKGKISSPSIIDGNSDFTNNTICIENIHSTYNNTNSSLDEEFLTKEGKNILILNDESHHIYNDISKEKDKVIQYDLKKWKELLLNKNYSFNYILGFTGTPYIGNKYFNDVIFKYSLKNAIEDKKVKEIEYLSDENISEKNKDNNYEVYHQIHNYNKKTYSTIKPISIMITSDIKNAYDLKMDLIYQLCRLENKDSSEISKKILLITNKSTQEEKILLDGVDDFSNPIEWIVSVSMLTEGWDAKNVFQIIPMEDRAFNSKLLIAQVLGRGLRKVPGLKQTQKVKVLNHPSWDKKINSLVKEVLEIETKIISSIVSFDNNRYKYNIELHKLNYQNKKSLQSNNDENLNEIDVQKVLQEGVRLISDSIERRKKITFNDINGKTSEMEIILTNEYTTIEDLTSDIFDSFVAANNEADKLNKTKTDLSLLSGDIIKSFISKSLETIQQDNVITSLNKQRLLKVFSHLVPKHSKRLVLKRLVNGLDIFNTSELGKSSLGLSNFRIDTTLFYDEYFEKNEDISISQIEILKETILNEDGDFPRRSSVKIDNRKNKTPMGIIFTSSKPEKSFVNYLIDNYEIIDKWLKSRDVGFYEIEYPLNKKQRKFNPDFIIEKKENDFIYKIIVEIKDDNDVSIENKRKNEYANKYFDKLNKTLKAEKINVKYLFTFLSPNSYQNFFNAIQDKSLFENKFNSQLSIKLEDLYIE